MSGEGLAGTGGIKFRLPIYEGPLDLLLHLIKKAELDAHDVTARIITEQYLAHVELLAELNLDVAGEYLVMAATLLLIKSFSMLPHTQPAEQEELEELRRDLVARLLEYQRYREAADKLAERAIVGRDVFVAPGEVPPPEAVDGAPLARFTVSLFDLIEAMGGVLKRLADNAPRDIKLRDIPIAQCIPRIMLAVEGGTRIEFGALFENLEDRSLVIATFVALLELVRRRAVSAYQERRFGPIWLERGDGDVADSSPLPSSTRSEDEGQE